MKRYFDIESQETITEKQLFQEYTENRKSLPDEFNYSFPEYISNCLTIHNGTLMEVKERG